MQTAKSLLTFLVLGLCVVSVSQAGPDNEAQAKAREAVRKKIAELEGQPPSAAPTKPEAPTPAAKPAAPITPKPEETAKPAAPVTPKPAAPAPTAPVTSFSEPTGTAKTTPEQSERLRQAVRDKISQLNAPAPAGKSAAEMRAEEKAAAAAAAAEQKRAAEEEKARQKAAAEEAKAHAAAEAKAAAKPPPPVTTKFEPLPAPPSAIPPTKEGKLADLLKKYKADEITPEQYHTERAKILAEP